MLFSSKLSLPSLLRPEGFSCTCGRRHASALRFLLIEPGAIDSAALAVQALGCTRPLLVCDENTYEVAGQSLAGVLEKNAIPFSMYLYPTKQRLLPSEQALGELMMHFDPACDLIFGVGSGVINDLCKMASRVSGRPCAIAATAPSMDGLASNSAAMEVGRVKTTIYTPSPAAILCDTQIMANAPERMLWAGIGDMAAKYVSICEWRISHLITGEYYCQSIAEVMRNALKEAMGSIGGVLRREPAAIAALSKGLVLSGLASGFAQMSRPASGLEHTFSHLWEMMALEREKPYDLHGIQVGIGTMLSLGVYDKIRLLRPTQARVDEAVTHFCQQAWEATVRRVFGRCAQTIIDAENTQWHKNAAQGRKARAARILDHWEEILAIIDEEMPRSDTLRRILQPTGMPVWPKEIGITDGDAVDAFVCSRDLRDRYIGSSLLWDIGYLEEFADGLLPRFSSIAG